MTHMHKLIFTKIKMVYQIRSSIHFDRHSIKFNTVIRTRIISITIFLFKMTLKFYSSLSKDLSLILNDSDDFNVIIQVGESQNVKEFRAHSVILRARSPYFKSALSANWITKKDNMIMFNKPNINPTIFDMILK